MMNAAVASEFKRLLGRLSDQPPMITVIMMVERMAEACQPVTAV